MPTPLTGFSGEFRERLLELLWRQWTALGVAGQGGVPWRSTPIDPEALLLVSCTAARRDARLFDAMLDWLRAGGRYLNVGRVRHMLKSCPFAGGAVYAAVAAATRTPGQAVKWARSAEPTGDAPPEAAEPLFRLPDGAPLPVVREPDPNFLAHGLLRDRYEPRGAAGPFRPETPACLLLRLRALLGVSARCEILAYLALRGRGSPRAMARECGYYPATVAKALAEMGDSGYVVSRTDGRRRLCALAPDAWRELLLGADRPAWIVWPALFAALERILLFLDAPERAGEDGLAQASALRRVLQADVAANLAAAGLPLEFGNWQARTGDALLPFLVERMRVLLDAVHGLG